MAANTVGRSREGCGMKLERVKDEVTNVARVVGRGVKEASSLVADRLTPKKARRNEGSAQESGRRDGQDQLADWMLF